jgi:tetratricopeptide (TPR) repeat protein
MRIDFPLMRSTSARGTASRAGLVVAAAVFAVLLAPAKAAKDETWLRVAAPEFSLVTSLPEKEAAAWAGEFSQYISELRNLVKVQGKLPPLTVAVLSRDRAFDEYRPLDEKGKPQPVAGFFLRHNSWAVAGLAGVSASEEIRRIIFHEGVHWFLSGLDRTNPVWVEEGLAEVFSTFAVTKKTVEWGHALGEHVDLLRDEGLMPTAKLLNVGRSELFRDTTDHTGIVYAQSWITVHFLLFGENSQVPRTALFDFLTLTNDGTPAEAAFSKAVGSDLATFDRRLKEYLRSGRYFIRHKPVEVREGLRAEKAAPVEVAQALGRLALAGHRWEKALAFARDSVAAAPDDPRSFELLGLARLESGDAAGGLKAFTVAVEKGSEDFQPYFALAVAAFEAAGENGETSALTPAKAREIADRYEQAINLAPRFLTSYQNLAGILTMLELRPRDREFMELGQKIFPRDGWIRVGMAVLLEKAGDRAAALKAVDEIESNKNEPARVRAYARQLSNGWNSQEVSDRLQVLVTQKKFSEALAYVQEKLSGPLPADFRSYLQSVRPDLRAGLRSEEIGRALADSRLDEARKLLTDTVASPDYPPLLKQQARRQLDELDRRTPARRSAK